KGARRAVPGIDVAVTNPLITTFVVVPVIYMVREAEGRIACTNNLKQLGIALGDYHGAHGEFPPATLPNVNLPPERRLSWLVLLLPYIEARPQLLLDRAKAWDAEENRVAYQSNEPKFPEEAQRRATEPKAIPVGQIRLAPQNTVSPKIASLAPIPGGASLPPAPGGPTSIPIPPPGPAGAAAHAAVPVEAGGTRGSSPSATAADQGC